MLEDEICTQIHECCTHVIINEGIFFEENRAENNSTVVMFFITKAELNFKKLKLNFIGAEDFK
jgi:hypothetical protein